MVKMFTLWAICVKLSLVFECDTYQEYRNQVPRIHFGVRLELHGLGQRVRFRRLRDSNALLYGYSFCQVMLECLGVPA